MRSNSKRYYYNIKERINPKFWDSSNQRAKKSFPDAMEFNTRLNNIKLSIESGYRKYLNNNEQQAPSKEDLIILLDGLFKQKQNKAGNFCTFLKLFIKDAEHKTNARTGKPISKNTIKTYLTTLRHLEAFELSKNKTYKFEQIDLEFYNEYLAYLTKQIKLSTNAVGKHFQIIKAIMNEATERGLYTNMAFKSPRFKVTRELSDSIYLNEQEIKEIYEIDLSANKKLEKVRDLFVVGCYTGLRFSDYANIKKENISSDGYIKIRTEKTDELVTIPILPLVSNHESPILSVRF